MSVTHFPVNEQLLLQEQVFGNDCSTATETKEPGNDY
jgi:hypothetical protein